MCDANTPLELSWKISSTLSIVLYFLSFNSDFHTQCDKPHFLCEKMTNWRSFEVDH